jgi:hypothetical protein
MEAPQLLRSPPSTHMDDYAVYWNFRILQQKQVDGSRRDVDGFYAFAPITGWRPCTNATAHPQRAHRRTTSDRSDIVLSPGTCKPHRQVRCPDTIAPSPCSRLRCLRSTRHTSCRHSTRVSLLAGTVTHFSGYTPFIRRLTNGLLVCVVDPTTRVRRVRSGTNIYGKPVSQALA